LKDASNGGPRERYEEFAVLPEQMPCRIADNCGWPLTVKDFSLPAKENLLIFGPNFSVYDKTL
jgi:hypothetical protein